MHCSLATSSFSSPLPAATTTPAPDTAANRKGKAGTFSSSPPCSRRALTVMIAASLLMLVVALLVSAGFGDGDRDRATPVESVIKLMHEKMKHQLHS
ncbi:hypothetical protein PVAP13_4KG248315 [Panicum virgatum]|uniref:Uncharacterized protein n=1 Tax=Panicum virgatum TaxID=38727 RepID=A0A8T0TT05_PANVG|nr:hypothetical protein PVAP13_4KG248315 [Panicum virgatum]